VALLGGVLRSSLSLVIIILEGTGAVNNLLPIIVTTGFQRMPLSDHHCLIPVSLSDTCRRFQKIF
jgi:H+/Cl- antiporter ClcA